MMKRLLIITIALLTGISLFAPAEKMIYLTRDEGINPFIPLSYAVRYVETGINPDTINRIEQAYGPRQIRQAKLNDFNKATGKNYTLNDCLREEVSHEVFLWHCSSYSYLEIAARRWNGSGPMTDIYWSKVKRRLPPNLPERDSSNVIM